MLKQQVHVQTMKSFGPVAMWVNTVEDGLPISTGSQAALSEWEEGALTPILWYTTPWLSTAQTLRVPQLIEVNIVSPERTLATKVNVNFLYQHIKK